MLVTSADTTSSGWRLMLLTIGRSNVLAASTNSVPSSASRIRSAPAQAPTAAEAQRVAAVLSPRTLPSSRMITPAPRKPMPDTTYATTRTAPSEPPRRLAISTKIAAPTATRTLVRRPAVRWRYWRSKPIRPPRIKAALRLTKVSIRESRLMLFRACMEALVSARGDADIAHSHEQNDGRAHGSARLPLTHPHAAVLHGIDDVLFHQAAGNPQALGDLRMGQAFDLAQREAVAARPGQLRQSPLQHVQAQAMVQGDLRRRAEKPLVVVEHVQRLVMAHVIAPVLIDHQVYRGPIEKRPWLPDRSLARTFEHPQVSVVHHVFGRLAIAQPGIEETHQLAVVAFQPDSCPHTRRAVLEHDRQRPARDLIIMAV